MSRFLAALAAAVLLSACGSDREAAPTGETSLMTDEQARAILEAREFGDTSSLVPGGAEWVYWATADDLRGVVLNMDDLPAGWSSVEMSTSDQPGESSDISDSFCGAEQRTLADLTWIDVSFYNGDESTFLWEHVQVFDSEQDAADALERTRTESRSCASWMDDDRDEVSISEIPFPSLGEDTLALSIGLAQRCAAIETVYVQVGNIVLSVGHGREDPRCGFDGYKGVDSKQTVDYTRQAFDKLDEHF